MANGQDINPDEIHPIDEAPEGPYVGWSALPGRVPCIKPAVVTSGCLADTPLAFSGCSSKKCVVPAQQPVIPVPVYQEIQKKDRIIEIPQIVVSDKIIPRVYSQNISHEIPKISLNVVPKKINIQRTEFREKIIEVPVPVGYNYKVVSKWNIREVPKIIPKYTGPQSEIYVEVPQVQVVEKIVQKQVPLYVGEKIVPKEIIEEEPVIIVQYRYVKKEEEVPVYKYTPVLDLEVDIPPPLVVPILVKPTEVELEPETISLNEWKQLKLGGTSSCCNNHGVCGPNSQSPCCGSCNKCIFASCQPGGVFSPSGSCGSVFCNKPVSCCSAEIVKMSPSDI